MKQLIGIFIVWISSNVLTHPVELAFEIETVNLSGSVFFLVVN